MKYIYLILAACAALFASPVLAQATCPGEGRITISPYGFYATDVDYEKSYAVWNRLIGEINPAMAGKNPAKPPAAGQIERYGAPGMLMATWLVKRGCVLAPLPSDAIARDMLMYEALSLMGQESKEYRRGPDTNSRSSAGNEPVALLLMRLLAGRQTNAGQTIDARSIRVQAFGEVKAAIERIVP